MKKATIARFVIGGAAIFAAFGLAACGAETGAPEAEGVGQASEAIVASEVAPATALPTTLANLASCTINDTANGSGRSYFVIVGGQSASTPTFWTNAALLDGTTWRTFALPSNMANGFRNGAAIVRPDHADECIVVGGEYVSSGVTTKVAGVVKLAYAVVGGHPGLTVSNAGQLLTARSHHELAAGPNGSVIVLGGNTGISSVEVWNGLLNTGAGPTGTTSLSLLRDSANAQNVALNTGRNDFAVSQKDPSHFAVAGGLNSGASRTADVEAFQLTTDATLGAKLATATAVPRLLTPALPTPRTFLKGFYKSTSGNQDTFIFAAGDKGGITPASNKVSEVLVDWSNSANDTVTETTTIQTATTAPALAIVAANHAMLFGGSVVDYQEDTTGTWTKVTTDKNANAITLRLGATAQYVPSDGVVYVAGGLNGATFLSSMDSVTAP